VPAAYVHPALSLALILINALLYVVPDAYRLLFHERPLETTRQ
jgi:hypothetical protein